MIFTYNKWERFCARLQKEDWQSISAREVTAQNSTYLVLKHDVETNVPNAHRMAYIEAKYGHRGSYYVQAYLLEKPENVELLQQMQAMGHEISYHYDVLDACKGDLERALAEFEKCRKTFENNGFSLTTVCQHGNPVMERVGYTSNRDFFRSARVQEQYPGIADIMVDYPEKYETSYLYFSDAGHLFKQIHDPINNDVVSSESENIPYRDLNELINGLSKETGNIISIHPHRWTGSAVKYVVKSTVFKMTKVIAKLLIKIPFIRKMMSRFYFLAKKF